MAKCDLEPPVISELAKEPTNLSRFQEFVEERTGKKFANYWELSQWSIEHYPDFWESLWHFYKIVHSQNYTEVFDKSGGFINMQWFKGAKLNYAENIFKHRDDHVAIISCSEEFNDRVESITYKQMYEEVKVYAAAMKNAGIKKGDIIACCMSNRKEAVLAFLATASIGAVWSGALPGLGAKAIISRFETTSPKILFTIDRFRYEGTENNMVPKLAEIAKSVPSLVKVIVVASRRDDLRDITPIPRSCYLHEFLSQAVPSSNSELEFEQLSFDHPLKITYTSGTTGSPKALVHGTGSFFATLRDSGLHSNLGRDDVLLSVSAVGWISWNILTNSLMLGCTLCLYEGIPFFLSPTYFWDFLEQMKISYVFVSPTTLEAMQLKEYLPRECHSMEHLRYIGAAGCPVKPHIFLWMRKILKPHVYFASCYGSSEMMGYCSGLDIRMPIYAGEIQCFALGVDGRTVDNEGNYVIGERENLVIKIPTPSMPVCLYNDKDNAKLKESYLTRHPGHFDQKDECWINPKTKGFIIFGRSDETLKQKGTRCSASEIYSAVWTDEECRKRVEDCLCVSQYNDQLDERAVLFLKMIPGNMLTEKLEAKIRDVIASELTPRHVPEIILETPGIPYNYSWKKMEILVKLIINKKNVDNRHIVINPECLDFYRDIPQLRNYH